MNLQAIQETITQYARVLHDRPNLYVWTVQHRFQHHWDLQSMDLADMFDQSLQSDINRRIWSRQGYQPKEIILQFIQIDPHLVHKMFTDLFHQERDLNGRINRFQFHADELIQRYRELRRKPHYAGHDQDLEIITFYLAMRFPAICAPYHHDAFLSSLVRFQARDLPVIPDPERWMKVARTLLTFQMKNQDLMNQYQMIRKDLSRYQGDTLLLPWDMALWILEEQKQIT